jgi:hypothetical protein
LVLNWKKCHFMVKQGIVLGHVISERGIEVDKAKVETVEQLPPPTDVKSLMSFLGHARFERCTLPLDHLDKNSQRRIISESRKYFWDAPYLFKLDNDGVMRRCVLREEMAEILRKCHLAEYGGHYSHFQTKQKCGPADSIGRRCMKILKDTLCHALNAKEPGISLKEILCP